MYKPDVEVRAFVGLRTTNPAVKHLPAKEEIAERLKALDLLRGEVELAMAKETTRQLQNVDQMIINAKESLELIERHGG